MSDEGRRLLEAGTPRPWVPDPWGIWTYDAAGPGTRGQRLYDADKARAADADLVVAAVNSYEALLDVADAAIAAFARLQDALAALPVSPEPPELEP